MKLITSLNFSGQCEAAFNFYAQVFGVAAPQYFRYGQSPMAAQTGKDWADKVMHVRLVIGDQTLYGADAPPPNFQTPQGFAVAIDSSDVAEAERLYPALSEGGKIGMALAETFWAKRFGMFTDRFGTPWMINVSKPM